MTQMTAQEELPFVYPEVMRRDITRGKLDSAAHIPEPWPEPDLRSISGAVWLAFGFWVVVGVGSIFF